MYALGIFALGNIHTVNLNNYGFDVHCESIKNMPNTKTKNTKHWIHFLSNNTYYPTSQMTTFFVICCCHRSLLLRKNKFFASNFLVSFWFMKLLHRNEYIIQVIFAWIFYDFWIFRENQHFRGFFFIIILALGQTVGFVWTEYFN